MKFTVLFALLALAAVAEAGKIEGRSLLSSGPKYCNEDTGCGEYEKCKPRYWPYCTYKKKCMLVDTPFCKTYNFATKCYLRNGPCEVYDTKKICKKEHKCAKTKNLEKCTYEKVCKHYDEKKVCTPTDTCLKYDDHQKCVKYDEACETKKFCAGYKHEKVCVPGKDICVKYELVETTDCKEIKTGCKVYEKIEKCRQVRDGCKEFKKREKCEKVKDVCYKGVCAKKG